jgi:hypothetical protein
MSTLQTNRRAIATAEQIIAKADKENRGLTEAESAQIESLVNSAQLAKNVYELGERMATPVGASRANGNTWGEAFVTSEGYRNLIEGGLAGEWSTAVEFGAAAGDPVLESTGSNADVIFQQGVPGLKDPGLRQERLTLANLFSQGQASGGTIRYLKVTTRTAPTETLTSEGADKPGAEFAFDDATAQLQKLAAFIPISEEMIEDAPYVKQYIDESLPLMVEQSLEAKLATALYAGAGLTAAPATLTGGQNGFDAIAAGINALQTQDFFEPDGLFIHPADYWALRIDKDDNDGYYGSGPWAGPSANPWGLRTVVSASATQGSPIVGAFKQGAELWRKGGTRLEASNSHDDYFQKNLVALRAELRYALTIYYSQAFAVVDVTGS